jgi:hypothetical protein
MTDNLVKRLRARQEFEFIDGHKRVQWQDEDALEAADRIFKLEQVLNLLLCEAEDVYVCMADATGIDRHGYPPAFQIARNVLRGDL